ncbi:MAG: xylulokinase [Trueperaceae bacterium]|nr:xylulokinase [Trueperaceae bacterium]
MSRPDAHAATRAKPAPSAASVREASVTIGLDVGTSGLKAVALRPDGSVAFEASGHYPLLTPQPGWTEQDPTAWWQAAGEALRALTSRIDPHRVEAVGVSGQMHGMVPLDEDGAPLRPALLWNDQRTAAQVRELEAAVPRDELVRRTGNPAVTGFQLPKVLWLRDEEPDAYARLRTVLFPKDWIAYRLTGVAAAEPTDASGSGAWSPATGDWDGELLDRVGIAKELFPQLVRSDDVVGTLTAEAAHATGLADGTPVVAGAGDNAAAATALGLGQGAPDLGSLSLGTSGVLFAPLSEPTPDPHGRIHLFAHADGSWNLLGVTLAAAGSLAWWMRRTGVPEEQTGDRVARALERPIGAGGVTFLPYLAGERSPFLDPDLRGGFKGLSLASEDDDLVRAVLEGVAFSLRDVWGVMQPLGTPGRLLATGGGARGDGWIRLLADVLNVPIGVPADVPGAAHGAAVLAWRARGHRVPAPTIDREWAPRPGPALEDAYARFRAHAPPLEPDGADAR